MTEKEKMISQKLFRDDDFLNEERKRAKDLCFKMNSTFPSQKEKIMEIAREILGKNSGRHGHYAQRLNAD